MEETRRVSSGRSPKTNRFLTLFNFPTLKHIHICSRKIDKLEVPSGGDSTYRIASMGAWMGEIQESHLAIGIYSWAPTSLHKFTVNPTHQHCSPRSCRTRPRTETSEAWKESNRNDVISLVLYAALLVKSRSLHNVKHFSFSLDKEHGRENQQHNDV